MQHERICLQELRRVAAAPESGRGGEEAGRLLLPAPLCGLAGAGKVTSRRASQTQPCPKRAASVRPACGIQEMCIPPQDKIGMYLMGTERRGLLAAFYLELTTGLRRGELLALLWSDLDVEAKTISITKQVNRIKGELVVSPPKTKNSIRILAIPQQAVNLLTSEHAKHPSNPSMCFPNVL